jgi:hypothetical protein
MLIWMGRRSKVGGVKSGKSKKGGVLSRVLYGVTKGGHQGVKIRLPGTPVMASLIFSIRVIVE